MKAFTDWSRPHFKNPLYNPFIFFVIYGEFDVDFNISSEKYKISGMPDGIDLMHYGKNKHPEVVKSFNDGFVWEQLKSSNKNLANSIESSTECFIFKGETPDSDNLEYFKNIIGVTTYLLDNGGIGIYDPFQIRYWTKEEWIEKVFKPNSPNPFNQVVILNSENENGTFWFHTRGLLKYGRPDLSLNQVTTDKTKAVNDLFNRFIQFQALGGIIAVGYEIKVDGLPNGMKCSETKGSFDDPDFNNKHIEIFW